MILLILIFLLSHDQMSLYIGLNRLHNNLSYTSLSDAYNKPKAINDFIKVLFVFSKIYRLKIGFSSCITQRYQEILHRLAAPYISK